MSTVLLDRSDIVRHPLVQAIVNAYEESEAGAGRGEAYTRPIFDASVSRPEDLRPAALSVPIPARSTAPE